MEKWKIATIAVLLMSLVGFGISQQNQANKPAPTPPVPNATPTPSPYLGKSLPAWNFTQWHESKPLATSSLQGQTTLVEVFRTECRHCADAAPLMAGLDNRYGPRGLKMIGIQSPGAFEDAQNPENNWKAVQTWLKERKIFYPVAFDEKSRYFQGTIQKQFLNDDPKKLSYPTMLIVGKDGKVAWAETGHDTAKAIALAVELEKRFPTSKSPAESAANLVKWLQTGIPDLQNWLTMNAPAASPDLLKAFTDDIEMRLKS
jgi:thiol-disulfide isomerase/thioredoxin